MDERFYKRNKTVKKKRSPYYEYYVFLGILFIGIAGFVFDAWLLCKIKSYPLAKFCGVCTGFLMIAFVYILINKKQWKI
jgi:hypothetical protein